MGVEAEPALLLQFVAEIAERLAGITTADELADVVLAPLAETLAADVANIALLTDERTLRLLAAVGIPDRVTAPWAEFDIAADVPLAASVREGRPFWLPDEDDARRQFSALPGYGTATSLCTLPLRAGSRVVGVLGLGWSERHQFEEAERQSLQAVAALVAAVLAGQRPAGPDRLEVHEHEPYDGVSIACLGRTHGARCSVQRGNPRPPAGPRSVFASLLDADPQLPPATLERASGVLALCRRRHVPPALVGQAISEITEDLDGPITGAHIEISDLTGWLAVAPLDDAVVVASTSGVGETTPPHRGVLAGERVVMAHEEPAVVVVVALDVSTDGIARGLVADAAARVAAASELGTAGDVVRELAREIDASETTPCVRGALAVVLQPRPDQGERSRTLPAQPVSSLLGRRFAVAAIPADTDPDTQHAVALVTSELVSNAIRHAHHEVDLTIGVEPDGTWIAVSDDDDRRLTLTPDDDDLESGRGLALIHALADRTGVIPRAAGGKVVWARVGSRPRS